LEKRRHIQAKTIPQPKHLHQHPNEQHESPAAHLPWILTQAEKSLLQMLYFKDQANLFTTTTVLFATKIGIFTTQMTFMKSQMALFGTKICIIIYQVSLF